MNAKPKDRRALVIKTNEGLDFLIDVYPDVYRGTKLEMLALLERIMAALKTIAAASGAKQTHKIWEVKS